MAKAAIIGFGGMGQRHLKAYEKAGVEVAAVCEWDPEKVFQILPRFPKDRVYKDHRALLEKESVDILSVVSNGPTHASVSLAAMEAGVPRVLCEKPVATNLSDAEKVVRACQKKKTRLAVNHVRRWSPSYDAVKSLIAEGAIGRLRHIYFQSGSTGLGNFAIHAFDTMRMLFGSEPDWVMGVLDKTGTPNPRGVQFRDPAGYGVIHFQNGARGFVDTSEDTGVQYQYVLAGEYGRVVIDELNDRWDVRARDPEGRKLPFTRYGTAMPPVPFKNPAPFDLVDLTSRAIQNLLSAEPVLSTAEDGFKSLELVAAFHLSDRKKGGRVELPLARKHWDLDIPIG